MTQRPIPKRGLAAGDLLELEGWYSIGDVRVGVADEPLRRWWPSLGDRFALSLLDINARRPEYASGER